MPLQINLLAEQQLEAELRRRDPVKRGYWVAAVAIAMVLVWALLLQLKVWASRSQARRLRTELSALESQAAAVRTNLVKTGEIERKLLILNQLATNRVLWAPALDTLQFALVEDIQLLQSRVKQVYLVNPGVRANPRQGVKEVPASSRESILWSIDAKCYAANDQTMQQQIYQFKRNLQHHPHFAGIFTNDNDVRMTTLNSRAQDPADPSRSFATFTLECSFPEKVR